jgi:hypothetical protein
MLIRVGACPGAQIFVSSFDDALAAERGRLLAAQAMANNPEQRKNVEVRYGLKYCKLTYPEVYQTTLRTGIGNLFDRWKIFLTQ